MEPIPTQGQGAAWRRLPCYTEMIFEMQNGSRMAVAVCTECRHAWSDSRMMELFEAVWNGWDRETNWLVNGHRDDNLGLNIPPIWTQAKRDEFLMAMALNPIIRRVD